LEPPHAEARDGRDTGTAPFAADLCRQGAYVTLLLLNLPVYFSTEPNFVNLILYLTKLHFQTSHIFSNEEANLASEIEKHAVLEFSDLELHLSTMGHVYGALVLHLLKLKRIRSVLRRLKVVRQSSQVIIFHSSYIYIFFFKIIHTYIYIYISVIKFGTNPSIRLYRRKKHALQLVRVSLRTGGLALSH
jgi:hypothetical protein